MVCYICQDCEKEFINKGDYDRHKNRKKKCTEVSEYKRKKLEKEKLEKEEKKKFGEELVNKFKDVLKEELKNELKELTEKKIIVSENHNNSHNNITDNSVNTNTNNANTNINLLNYAIKEFPNAKNFEDCFNANNITDEMKKECSNKYYNDGAVFLMEKLCSIGETKRPIHCADASRRHYIVKREGKWEKDLGAEKLKQHVVPIIDDLYFDIYQKRFAKNRDVDEHLANLETIEAKTRSKRFKKIIDSASGFFVIKKNKHKEIE